MELKFKIGDEVYLDRYWKHPNESENWSIKDNLPLNKPLKINTITSIGWLYFKGHYRCHPPSKFKPILELNKEAEFNIWN